jgi:hypothetical protein
VLGKRSIAAALLALCLLAPASALAAEEEFEGVISAFTLKASHGYQVRVLASSDREDGVGDVLVLVGRKHAAVLYATKAKVTPTGLEVDLGQVGTIDVDYVAMGGTETVRPKCGEGDGPARFERAEYRGTIELHGEEGFTDVSANRVRIRNGLWFDLFCSSTNFDDSIGPGLPGARLHVRSPSRGSAAFVLDVKKNRPGAQTYLSVSTRERRGDVAINRGVEVSVGAGAFAYDPLLSTARLDPPAPFSGSASFHRGAKPANRWRGNLSVDLPGRSNVPLAGPGLRTSLVHARWSRTVFHSERPVRAATRF